MSLATGQDLGWNILLNASMGAVSAAVSYGLGRATGVSEASQAEAQRGDSIPASHANVGESNDGIQRGGIRDGEPIADPHVKKEMWRMWKRSGTGNAAHEEGISIPRDSDGTYGKAERWKPSITLGQSRRMNITDGNDHLLVSQPRSRLSGSGGVEAHSHPWKVGTRMFKQNGNWQVAAPGPSWHDVAASVGYDALRVDVTSYVVAPEGIYRIGSRVEWIAPVDYIRPR